VDSGLGYPDCGKKLRIIEVGMINYLDVTEEKLTALTGFSSNSELLK